MKRAFASLFAFLALAVFAFGEEPPKLQVRNDRCGDNECCNMSLEWTANEPVAVFEKPGHGKKLGLLEAGEKVKVQTAQTVSTRGKLKFWVDKGTAKANQTYYFYDFNNGKSFEFYSLKGEKLKHSEEFELLSSALFKPLCLASKCLGEVLEPSKGETYFLLRTKKGLKGWINADFIEPKC
jgi:hypothetical protein